MEEEPVLDLQEVTGETLNHGSNKTLMLVWIFIIEDFGKDRNLHSSTFGCADSYRDLTPKQIYKKHENEKR